MSRNTQKRSEPIQIALTPEQKEQFQKPTGREGATIKLALEELEERLTLAVGWNSPCGALHRENERER